jgi:hypothetical protein
VRKEGFRAGADVREGTSCRLHAHFPKCRHRPDPAARSGDLCEEPVTFRGSRSAPSVTVAMSLIEEVRFASDSPLDGFEPSVPRQKDNAFRDSSFPTCARATAAFENARRPVQQLLLPVVDPVRMNAELTRQLGDRPVPPTAATTTPSL